VLAAYFLGALHSATTERRAFIMESNEKTSTYFLTVNGEKITVSHEVYQMIRKENNASATLNARNSAAHRKTSARAMAIA